MNINNGKPIRACTSCQMCGAVCPTGAITISLDDYGFYRPFVNNSKCIDCGLCTKVCYKYDSNVELTENIERTELYGAYVNDKETLNATTSGGIADILAKKLILCGYKCIGVTYDVSTNKAVGKIASTLEGTDQFRGSKYIQSYSFDVFKELVKNCSTEKFAIFGLPCQIYAIGRFLNLRKQREKHILIDLYCHGCPSIKLWKKYTDEIEHINGRLEAVQFRSKKRGWGRYYVKFSFCHCGKPKSKIAYPFKDKFYELFFSDLMLNAACSDCILRSTMEYTDIRLGDFWGKSYVSNITGVSAVSICSKNGQDLFNQIKDKIKWNHQLYSNLLPYQSYGKNYTVPISTRGKLFDMLNDGNSTCDDLIAAYNNSLPIKTRLINNLKYLIELLPNRIISIIKYLFYHFKLST